MRLFDRQQGFCCLRKIVIAISIIIIIILPCLLHLAKVTISFSSNTLTMSKMGKIFSLTNYLYSRERKLVNFLFNLISTTSSDLTCCRIKISRCISKNEERWKELAQTNDEQERIVSCKNQKISSPLSFCLASADECCTLSFVAPTKKDFFLYEKKFWSFFIDSFRNSWVWVWEQAILLIQANYWLAIASSHSLAVDDSS